MPHQLRSQDWRSIVRLVGECRDLGDDATVWREHLFSEVGRLTGASLVVGGETVTRASGMVPLGTAEWGWENGFDRAVMVQALSVEPLDLTVNPHFAAYFACSGSGDGAGLTRRDLVPDRDWVQSEYFRSVHEPLGIGHTLISFWRLGSAGELSGLTLSQAAAVRRDFSPRDRALVRELHAAIGPLIGGPLARFTEPSPSDLSFRVRQVLRSLLEGDSDKQIAVRLGLSKHTVNDYTKVVFTHFGVSGRAELSARWISRGWGRSCEWGEEAGPGRAPARRLPFDLCEPVQ